MKPILIIGASSFGKLLRVLVEDTGREFGGFVDDFNTGDGIIGRGHDLGPTLSPEDFDLVLAIGYRHLDTRLKILDETSASGFDFPVLVHPRAHVSRRAQVGAGCVIMAGASIDAFALIEPACVLWPGSIVSHDSVVGRNSFLSPGATLCGFVEIGPSTFVGAGSVVVDHIVVPANAFIKSGTRYDGRTQNAHE